MEAGVDSGAVIGAEVEAEGVSGEVEEGGEVDMIRVPRSGLCPWVPFPTPARRTWWSSPAFRMSPTSMPPFTSRT